MNRLQAELQRLYLSPDMEREAADPEEPGLVGPGGRVRAMVLELARPASWDGLAKVWRGVQVDLELPAPSIAVSGIDGYQLWFSLSESVSVAQAIAFLDLLRRRYLGDIPQEHIGMKPSADASAPGHAQHEVLPPAQRAAGRWSAFVAPDLAALFADEPWLDLPPGADAQADLLSRLNSMKPADLKRALERLRPADTPGSAQAPPAAATDSPDPRRFLLEIMNDRTIELHLRIEAAKALLPYFEGPRPL
ncbi:hypothetical protein [Caenimonas soli]|uniref:hypothetical protein n=1 Tax=Caenimonas soli TaxID=2735555 RepID=UPI0015530A7F|nr:hypothetical protein [Caenimonas soli]NPC55320.1 hypothetical protein [Caenimonas soli]